MTEYIRLIYTKRMTNPISWAIRWMIPPSRASLARSSHCIVVDGDEAIEANMIYGVRVVPLAEALKGARVVDERLYRVEDARRGLDWFRGQACTYTPKLPSWLPGWLRTVVEIPLYILHNNYDFAGALGLGLAPDRDWQDPSKWHCYEGGAGTLRNAGLDVFSDSGFITETVLLGIKNVKMQPFIERVA